MGFLDGLREAIAFLTILPAGTKDGDWTVVADYMWLFPIIGLMVGGIAAVLGSIFLPIFPPSISSALALFFLLSLTGFHHLDGLLDFGDAIMYRGTVEKRRAVMQDVNTGVGGFGLGFFVLLIAFLSINEFLKKGGSLFLILVTAEVLAKLSMVTASYLGKPFHEGMGSMFTDAMKKSHVRALLAVVISAVILYFMLQLTIFILIIVSLFSSLVLVWISNQLLGGISGDTLGAVNEVTRTVIMLALVVI